ncbi:MAG: T9SS type A sorting domain-containing protein [Chitinophagaceae bacterium]
MKRIITLIAGCALYGSVSAQTVVNGNMESWVSYTSSGTTLARPANWFSSDSLIKAYYVLTGSSSSFVARCSQSTTVYHGGSSSAVLITNATDTLPSVLANSNITFSLADIMAGKYQFKYPGGTPVTSRVLFGHAWVKLTSTGSSDVARMNLSAIKSGIGAGGADSTIGSGYVDIPSNTGFTKVDVSVTYKDATTVPDRIVVSFVPTNKSKPVAGTTMWIDDVTLSDPAGIETPIFNNPAIRVFPNPVQDELRITADMSEELSVSVYSVNGQEVARVPFKENAVLSVSRYAAGNYIYVVGSKDGQHQYASGSFVKH